MGILDQLKAILGKPAEPIEPALDTQEFIRRPLDRRNRTRQEAREGLRVLVIDDSPTIVAVLRKVLSSAGYQPLEALDAETGLEIALKEKPDLIFLDIVLPGMNGFAALRHLRRDLLTRDIPVIMMSGNEQATEQFFGTRIGADDFMKKPFSREEIFARIERLLDEEGVPKRRLASERVTTIIQHPS